MSMIRVVKVGGSLLDWPGWAVALNTWLAGEIPATNVLICGGGKLVDGIRQWDRIFSLHMEESERLAINGMSANTAVLASMLEQLEVIAEYEDLLAKLRRRRSKEVLVFDAKKLLNCREALLNARPLPRDWTVTSDSIAAWLAELLAAEELVLLKSADRPSGGLNELAAAGYVDAFFPAAAKRIKSVRFENLRTANNKLAAR